jgi:hypothetical protein
MEAAMARKIAQKRKAKVVSPAIMRNQFFGMLVLAVGIGALIVMVRYFVISLQVPTDVYLIEPSQLIPGMSN